MREFFGVLFVFFGVTTMIGGWVSNQKRMKLVSSDNTNYWPYYLGALFVGIGLKLLKIT